MSQIENKKLTLVDSDITNIGFGKFDPIEDDLTALPKKPGNYIVVLKAIERFPSIEGVNPHFTYVKYQGEEHPVIYTGVASKSLFKRDYKQHFLENNAGKSTLRKSLGCLMGFKQIKRDKKEGSKKTKFNDADEEKLSDWMRENLLLFAIENPDYDNMEKELIELLNPPLNITGTTKLTVNKEFRTKLKELRNNKDF